MTFGALRATLLQPDLARVFCIVARDASSQTRLTLLKLLPGPCEPAAPVARMAAVLGAAACAAAPVAPPAGRAGAASRHVPCAAVSAPGAARLALPPRRARACARARGAHGARPLTAAAVVGAGLFAPSGDGRGSFAAPKRLSVTLPAVVLTLSADEVAQRADVLESAIAAGATAVVVVEAAGGAAQLYDAACALRALLRGRATLLVAERADIAAASEADGVLLSPAALPTVVARRSLEGSRLVLRQVATADEAVVAARDGADALLLSDAKALQAARPKMSVPLLAPAPGVRSPAALAALVAAGADGLTLPLAQLGPPAEARNAVAAMLNALNARAPAAPDAAAASPAGADEPPPPLLSAAGAALVASERALLASVLSFLREATPGIAEASLLEEALAALDEPFLLVVAGEFNSGKSSVINALLGRRFVAEGILPTTNEISVLRASPDGKQQRTVPAADGHFDIFLPSPLLRQLSIVDTPGTNVILERQQRLTEEFVPRADLVLFVLSADRPLTESEARFLSYIRQWDKRVVFALNKVDSLASPAEVAAVRAFVADNAARLLGTPAGDGEVFPVSARAALAAKDAAGGSKAGVPPPAWGRPPAALAARPEWQASGFAALEAFVARFLGGDAAVPGEALRLKLLTPLSLAAALLDAAQRALTGQADAAAAERAAAAAVARQMEAFKAAMEKDALIQRSRVRELVRAAAGRGERFVDAQLRLQNTALLRQALAPRPGSRTGGAGGDDADAMAAAVAAEGEESIAASYAKEVVAGGMDELRDALAEHSAWLARNAARQRAHYSAVVAARGFGQAMGTPVAAPPSVRPAGADAREARNAPAPPASAASAVAARFDQGAAALLLAEEVRQAAVATAGSAGAALAVGVVLTAVLPSFGEDALSLALAALGAYVGLLNLPLRRAEVKAKLQRAADAFAAELDAALQDELRDELGAALSDVQRLVEPWEAAAAAEAATVAAAQKRRDAEDDSLRKLQATVQKL
jgi:GTP-binding protein EngB required for normal cell division